MTTTSCTKPIWIVIFQDPTGKRPQRVAAYKLKDVLDYFNEDGLQKIIEIKKTDEQITYHY